MFCKKIAVNRRVLAYGVKWRRWYLGQRYWKKAKVFPERHRKKKLATMSATGELTMHPQIQTWYARVRDWNFGTRP